jgi:DNA phosphorothioation-dependent restriction protein DptH
MRSWSTAVDGDVHDPRSCARVARRIIRSGPKEAPSLCFTLDIYHPAESSAAGSFLATVGRRRRAGRQVTEADRWMTETAARPGEVMIPRLRWARRPEPSQADDWPHVRATHLGLAFDLFEARLETRSIVQLGKAGRDHQT